jgi:hypothetical protein
VLSFCEVVIEVISKRGREEWKSVVEADQSITERLIDGGSIPPAGSNEAVWKGILP